MIKQRLNKCLFILSGLLLYPAAGQPQPLYEPPGGCNVPSVYEAAAHDFMSSRVDVQYSLVDTTASSNRHYLAYAVPLMPLRKGTLSYYGQSSFNGSSLPDMNMQKLFISGRAKKAAVSFGCGYDYATIRSSELNEHLRTVKADTNGHPIALEPHKSLDISAYNEQDYYGNANIAVPMTATRLLVAATELRYRTQRGYLYAEQFDADFYSSNYTQDVCTYTDLGPSAYSYNYHLSAGVLTFRRNRHNRPFSLLYDLAWDRAQQHSEARFLEDVTPYFTEIGTGELGTAIQFAGIHNTDNIFTLRCILADQHPNQVCIERPFFFGPLHGQIVIDHLDFALSAAYNTIHETFLNQWERNNSVSWGRTDHAYTHAPMTLTANHALRLYLFRYLFFKTEYYSDKHLSFAYQNRYYSSGVLNFNVRTFLGAKFTINNRMLVEIQHSVHHFHTSFSLGADNQYLAQTTTRYPHYNRGTLVRFSLLP